MTTSRTIAGLIGPTLAAMGLAMLINLGSFPEIVAQVAHDPPLIFVLGILLFVAGIAIVRVHNVWSGGWPVVVTVLGWLAIVGGIGRMFFPTRLAAFAATLAPRTGVIAVAAIILLVLGAYLSWQAYRRNV
jgi:hypothetical protein